MMTIVKKQWVRIGVLLAIAAILFFIFDEVSAPAANNARFKEAANGEELIIPNQGGNFEGHTPRGFAGMGTGLFAGDNLNPRFPEGDGVQAFLTFDITTLKGAEFDSVILSSDAAHVRGTPFEDLGNLIVDSVVYDSFSSALWNTPSRAGVCTLATEASDAVSCDVTDAVRAALEDDARRVQFRLRFETAGDSDGVPDMVLFYTTNSNTNEPGIFRLRIEGSSAKRESGREQKKEQEQSVLHVPVVAHLIKGSAEASTRRNQAGLEELFARTQTIWSQANVVLDVSFEEVMLNDALVNAIAAGDFNLLYTLVQNDDSRFHIFYVGDILGPNGIALAPQIALIADKTSVDDFRATAHEIGHLLGLEHTTDSRSRLMFPGANGRTLTRDEALIAREHARAIEQQVRL